MARDISNTDDIIDSRDIIERIEWLREEMEQGGGLTEAEANELRVLLALQEQAEGYAADWKYGEALIRDSYFEEYAEQLADDIGVIDRNAQWPLNCIDWKQAARELQMDYTAVDFDGVTYWIR